MGWFYDEKSGSDADITFFIDDFYNEILGNAGVAGATISYADTIVKTAVTNDTGGYNIVVSFDWTGMVTPSKTGFTFNPVNRNYANLIANETYQDYIATADVLPVELTSFTASANCLSIQLNWSTATERNNYGFEVERRQVGNDAVEWMKVGFVSGGGTKASTSEYSYTDIGVAPGRYAYRIKQIDNNETFRYGFSIEVEIGLAANVLTLNDAHPNPFNSTTLIEFTIPNGGRVTLKVYNTIGQEVANFFDGQASAGRTIQVRFDSKSLATGLYFARLQFGGKIMLKKMLFVK